MTKILAYLLFAGLGSEPPADVADLVRKLGDDNFTIRKNASRDLEQMGSKALPVLRRAVHDSDLEVQNRCRQLVEKIEVQVMTQQLLTPRRVSLRWDKLPFKKALDVFKGEGIAAQVRSPADGHPLITLDLEDVPRWQAWQKFCDAAGLAETARAVTSPGTEMYRDLESKSRPLPADVMGPLRFRARPAAADCDAAFFLEVLAAPRDGWDVPLSLRIDPVHDENGHVWKYTNPWMENESYWHPDATDLRPWPRTDLTAFLLPVRLDGPATRPVVLKQLRGSVTFKVRAELTLLEIDPSSGEGQIYSTDSGVRLKMIGCDRQAGKLDLRFELRNLAALPVSGAEPRIIRVRPGFIAQRGLSDIALDRIYLLDRKGRRLTRESTQQQALSEMDGGAACRIVFDSGDLDSVRLRLCALRIINVEVPFTLHDVRLP